MRSVLALALASFALGCGKPVPPDYPAEAVAILQEHMSGVITLSGDVADAGYHVYDLGLVQTFGYVVSGACYDPPYYLTSACSDMQSKGVAPGGCTPVAASVGSEDSPRCAIRVTLPPSDSLSSPRVLALDLDACTSFENCQFPAFNGCETVIQRHFQAAEIATVNAATWSSPRTHVMVHEPVAALRPLDGALCDAARGAAANVCDELLTTMSFIGTCQPVIEFGHDKSDFCSVRFDIGFSQENPANSVLTTRLDGLLSFTIR